MRSVKSITTHTTLYSKKTERKWMQTLIHHVIAEWKNEGLQREKVKSNA